MNDLSYYDQWNPKKCPPPPGACPDCNGLGYDPYTYECEACNGTGAKWAWRWLYYLRFFWHIHFYNWRKNLVTRCLICGKPLRVGGIPWPHDQNKCSQDYIPF